MSCGLQGLHSDNKDAASCLEQAVFKTLVSSFATAGSSTLCNSHLFDVISTLSYISSQTEGIFVINLSSYMK